MINIEINYTGNGPSIPGMKRHYPKAKKVAHKAAGVTWHKKYLSGHFKMSAYQKYGYKQRSGADLNPADYVAAFAKVLAKYNSRRHNKRWKQPTFERFMARVKSRSYVGRKLKSKHHNLPMVWSGVTRDRAERQDVRATSSLTRVVLNARALNFKKPGGPDMVKEITTILQSEAKVVETQFGIVVERELKNSKSSGRKRIGK